MSNPGVVRLPDNTIAMVYRGCGSNNIGHLGFCLLDTEGRRVIAGSRSDRPLNRRSASEKQEFPGGYGDPRINRVGEWYYVWANARNNEALRQSRELHANNFAGQYIGGRQTVAFRTKDFKSVEYLGLHGPDEFDKNSFLHPAPVEIDDELHWAFFHRIQYSVQVALPSAIETLKERGFWRDHVRRLDAYTMLRPIFEWEGVTAEHDWPGSVSAAAPPIEISPALLPDTMEGAKQHWLLFYNASGPPRDGKIAKDRRVGAVVYALKDRLSKNTQPFHIVARTPQPILLPREPYEFDSPNGDVVFATGAVATIDGSAVDIFYGSGDEMISKARFKLDDLLAYIFQFDASGNQVALGSNETALT